jgi:molybdenum cofactor sulfurtransferase
MPSSQITPQELSNFTNKEKCLVGYPLQCNSTGTRFPIDWCDDLKSAGHIVVLDISSSVSTSSIDLSVHSPDFVVFSIYKMFGYPSGVGCLLVKKDSEKYLTSRYFGGGNVVHCDDDAVVFKANFVDRFEYGTVSFLDILGIEAGFMYVDRVFGGWTALSGHVIGLAEYLRDAMTRLVHYNGVKVVGVVSIDGFERGPILNFQVYADDGETIPVVEVVKLCSINNIHIRAGCFCNPGTCVQGENDKQDQQETPCGFGKGGGSLRVSLGMSNTLLDITLFLKFLVTFFCNQSPTIKSVPAHSPQEFSVQQIIIYPIKSCGGLHVEEWTLGEYGFIHDRSYMLVDSNYSPLTQKRASKMTTIKPKHVDNALLVLDVGGIELLIQDSGSTSNDMKLVRVCGER